MAKEVRCAELGYFPDCDGVVRGDSEDEVMAGVAEHARSIHGMSDEDFTDEALDHVRTHIRDL